MHYGWNGVALKPERENFTPGPMYRANSCFVLMLDALLALFRYEGRPIGDCDSRGVAKIGLFAHETLCPNTVEKEAD
jgi:hypothetical protein